jgi:hypothetical protein
MNSIEWLEKKLIESGVNLLSEEVEFIKQAKEMHRAEQISQLEEIVSRLEEDGLYALQGIKNNIESLKKD